MKRVYIYCEGQTEESFIKHVLYDYLFSKGIIAIPIICSTKRESSKASKGGIQSFNKFSSELKIICKTHKNEQITTMIDYYGLPSDFPLPNNDVNNYTKIKLLEQAIEEKIGAKNLKVYVSLHEFEALLFSDEEAFSFFGEQTVSQIKSIKDEFNQNPEYINNSPITAPSKRLANHIPSYSKVSDGTKLAKEIGIERILKECSHFREWVSFLLAV